TRQSRIRMLTSEAPVPVLCKNMSKYSKSHFILSGNLLISPFIQHNQIVSNYFGCLFPVHLFVFPAAGMQLSFYIDGAAFMKVLCGQFGQPTPQNYLVPFCLRYLFTRFVFKTLGSSQ